MSLGPRIVFRSSYGEGASRRVFILSPTGARIAEVCVSEAYRRGEAPWADEPALPFVDALLRAANSAAKPAMEDATVEGLAQRLTEALARVRMLETANDQRLNEVIRLNDETTCLREENARLRGLPGQNGVTTGGAP